MTRTKYSELSRHHYYEVAVQSVDADLDFARRVYRKHNGASPTLIREDFCGTASLACRWVQRWHKNRALGVDLDKETLDWGLEWNLSVLGRRADRVKLIRHDVREVTRPKVDLTMALNFSYFVFKTRPELLSYFKAARRSLKTDGLLILDLFGGSGAMEELVERQYKPAATTPSGVRVPGFTYVWEQALFNPVNHHLLCHIHFEPRHGRNMKKAFTYDWRMWTIPEVRELLREAGFGSSEVYIEGWDEDEDESDGIFRMKNRFENQEAWVAYVVGVV